MTESKTLDTTAEQLMQQYRHAVNAMVDTQKMLNSAGVRVDVIASAAATAYMQVCAAIAASGEITQKECIEGAKTALDALDELVDDVYADMSRVMAKMGEGEK